MLIYLAVPDASCGASSVHEHADGDKNVGWEGRGCEGETPQTRVFFVFVSSWSS
jgi:hypothetical protein